jgi:hypothetical protein
MNRTPFEELPFTPNTSLRLLGGVLIMPGKDAEEYYFRGEQVCSTVRPGVLGSKLQPKDHPLRQLLVCGEPATHWYVA